MVDIYKEAENKETNTKCVGKLNQKFCVYMYYVETNKFGLSVVKNRLSILKY